MERRNGVGKWLGFIFLSAGVGLAGCAGMETREATGPFPCVSESRLEKQIGPEARLEDLSCSFKEYEGVNTLHFKVAVKNVSPRPQRFRVQIFLDNGKAVGGLIPQAVKKGLVAPGKTESFVYPVVQMPKKPKSVILKISAVTE